MTWVSIEMAETRPGSPEKYRFLRKYKTFSIVRGLMVTPLVLHSEAEPAKTDLIFTHFQS